MKPAQKLVIQSLSTLVAEKRAQMEQLGLMNVYGDEAKRMRDSIAYSQARADLWNAESALREAIKEQDEPAP